LGGFGGFLSKDFRQHDFFLGRRNAQKFLKDHFVLPASNPLFASLSPAQCETYCVRSQDGKPRTRDGQLLLPLIPLVGTAGEPCEALPWPAYRAADLANLKTAMERRIGLVIDRLVNRYFASNFALRLAARTIFRFKRRELTDYAAGMVEKDLRTMGLLR
jgi:hypothetical protein